VPLEHRVMAVFALSIALLGATGLAAWTSTGQSAQQAQRVQREQEALTRLASLRLSLADAEAGARGFVITGEDRFLEPYRDARVRSQAELEALRALAGEALPVQRLDSIAVLVARRHDLLADTVQIRRSQGFAAAGRRVANAEGAPLHEETREIEALAVALRAEIGPGARRAHGAQQRTRTVVVAGGVIALLFGGLAARRIVTEIRARRAVEVSLRERNQTLQDQAVALRAATLHAEAADRTKSAFLATMSHELRTPMNSIIGFTGILLQRLAGPLNTEQARQLGMVRSSARHLLALINDVLDISKIEAGQLEVARVPCDLGACIDRALATAQPLAAAKGLALSVEVQPGLRQTLAHAVGDPRRVEQVLLNLLGNAIKFTDRGSVQLQARTDDAAPGFVCIAVVDTGIGITRADQATLFQPFRQVDGALSRAHEGTGLGLAISHRLAGLMGGMISVRSEPGQGAQFTLRLPLRTPESAPHS
jgi:signal transduction histidine kinase